MNYISLFKQSAVKWGERTALVDSNGKRCTSYSDLDSLSSKVAGKLDALGFAKGDFILVNMGRRMEYMAAYLGVLKAGCVVVPVVPDYPDERVEFIRTDCGSRLTITEDFLSDIEQYDPFENPAEGAEPALLAYTSGSTGTPKGILFSTADLARGAIRHESVFEGVSPVIYAGAALFSFLLQIIEYHTVFAIGGTTHILEDNVRKSAVSMAAYYKEHGITVGIITPQMLRLYHNTDPALQRVITCGERVSRLVPDGYDLLCGYGMSETAAFVTTFLVDKSYDNTPIGRSMQGVEVSILDDDLNPVPDGTEGEICPVGEFDTVYFKDPEKTSCTMLRMPDGRTLIRTGDIGYVNDSSDIVFSNRKDWMVKVNGQRVETLEIEGRLMDMPQIGNAAVKAFEDEDSQNYLVAYYVEKEHIDESEIRKELSRTLPEYMIPRFIVRMEEMPRNVNGKLDRKALLPPAADMYKAAYRAPADALEKALCEAFEKVLHCGIVGTQDDFFSLGGDSIKVLRLLEGFDSYGLTPDMIFKARTPKAIAALCEAGSSATIPHNDMVADFIPLSDSQLGVYLDGNSDPESVKYNIPVLCRLPENTDTGRFKEAVKKVARCHKALNVTVSEQAGVPGMHYRDSEVVVKDIETRDLDAACKELVRPFDLSQGPLYRFYILHSPEGDSFFFDIHHIVFDGSSVTVLLEQIASVYGGGECRQETLDIFDVASAGNSLKETEAYKKAQDFFKERFDGMECDSTPVPDVVTDDDARGAGHVCVHSDGFDAASAGHFARIHGITENTLFLGAFAYALAKLNGACESYFCTVNNGRHDRSLADSVGMFVRTLPMYFTIDEGRSVPDFLSGVQDALFGTMSHDCMSFAELSAQYGLGMSITFVYQAGMFAGPSIAGGRMDVRMLDTPDIQSDIHFMLYKTGDSYTLDAGYRKSLYTEGFISRFASMYFNVVKEMMEAGTLSDVVLADSAACEAIREFNRTEVPYESDSTVVDLFRRQAALTPDGICLVYEDKKFTYREVDSITDALAAHLLESGMGKGSVVGILIPRCEHMLLSALGTLKAGCAYLPLDPSYPQDRLNLMVRDSGAGMLITTPELSGIIAGDFAGARMMADAIPSLPEASVQLPCPRVEDPFIILYTSGSTGTPKGVVFTHANTMVTAAWERRFYDLGPGCNVTAYASFGFDANVFDTYATVISGATLHIISDEIRLDLPALKKYFNVNGITHSTMTTQVGRQFAQMGGLETLKFLNVAGEKLTPLAPPQGFRLFNLYGPTEGSILASGFLVDRLYKDIPIGKAVDNVKLYVVDPKGRLLPPGAVGELWISGAHVTAGYLNRPEKTAESYGSNPFCDDKGYERVYRTGDIVRYMEDGNLQFIGRRDAQVKVRGFRVELTEVEEVIRRFPGIEDATVAAFDDPSGGKFIAAYVVSGTEVDVEALGAFIREEKPPYMLPAVTMQIDSIPLNQNQKVNRKALPRPERKAGNLVPPENDIQRKICGLVADVLGHGSFGIETDLFEAGLTSIGVLRLNVLLGTEFDVSVKIEDIKSHETVRKLESLLQESGKASSYEIREDYPLSQTQMGIFVECSSAGDSVAYNIPVLFILAPEVDTDRLAAAVRSALDVHPYSKATLFADPDGNIRARRNDDTPACVSVERMEHIPEGPELVRPFSLLDSPLYRASVIKTPEGNCLFLDFHHIISDGTSEAILLSDIDRAYAGEELVRESFSGFEAALEEEQARSSDKYAKAKDYYTGVFGGCDTESLPPKSPERNRDKDSSDAGRLTVRLAVPVPEVSGFCRDNRLTLNAFFNSVFGYTLGRFGNRDESLFTTVYNGRSDSRLSSAFTMLVKTLPVLVRLDDKAKVVDFVRATQSQLMDSMANDIYSFAEISRECSIKSDIIFVYQGDNFDFDTLCGGKAEFRSLLPPVAKAPLTLNMNANSGVFEIEAEYRRDIFSESYVKALLGAMEQAVLGFIDADVLGKVSLLSPAAERRLAAINDTARSYERVSVNRFFERHAAATPDRTAVVCDGRSLTYDELNRMSNRLSHRLIECGVGRDDVVGMVLDRTVLLPVAEMGILKSGGAFLGILPEYPDERILYCLSDSASPVLLTTADIKASRADLFGADKPYRTLVLEEVLSDGRDDNPDLDIPADSLAYCIYTSGSTGKPKGVMIEHGNLSCLASPADFTYSLYHGDKGGKVSLALSSISFDMSVFDNLLHLLNGKTVCIATDREIHNPAALASCIADSKVDMLATTPSVLSNYIGIPEFRKALEGIHTIVSGAEAFPGTLFDQLREISPRMHIINGYGPSECTATCCAKELESGSGITIGGPAANTAFYVMDKAGNILPPMACGELVICGDLVGRGYVNLPEKTAAVFFTLNGRPAYHSGDVVRLNADGEVEFFGRIDNQVKLRGFRVELDEIERSVVTFDGVKQCKVVVRSNGSEDYLAGFFTADSPVDVAALTAFLKSRLTYYMVPDVLLQIDEIPLTPSGKVNVKALPEVKREARKSSRKAPKKSLEQEICELFKSVLSLEDFYADDNFFEMGGTSLSASKVIMQLMSKGIKVEYQDIFDHPTPEDLSEYIESQRKPETDSGVTAEKPEGDDFEYKDELKYNTIEYAHLVQRKPVGDVLLTGAVGFLGIHILKELLDRNEGRIICLVRKGEMASSEERLQNMMMYYFDNPFEDAFKDRISVIDADITDDNVGEILSSVHFDTLINCAAIVKHYSSDDIIEKVNVHGVENLIAAAMAAGARMVQISTVSVPGVHTKETYIRQVKMHENELFVIDDMDNKYGISKYHAELKMLEAVRKGLRGKIVRVGNLMGRHSDGEFQINFNTNAFMNALRGFVTIGKCPISHATDPMSFSPIDMTAKAIVLLAGTDDRFTAFHADSRFGFDEMQLIQASNRCGLSIVPVKDEEYYSDYYRMLGDSKVNAKLQGLVTNDRPDLHMVDTDNLFTANVLYRLGFSWPLVEPAYLERAIESLLTLDYFEPDE
ncbi:MAG: amino acid adenylation domain-containing protein [Bacteroidales bacterium]|nr:amino acid adenylation domain-containing protein [Bacteroidales bacterium]